MPYPPPNGLRKRLAAIGMALLITCLLSSQFVAANHELTVRHATCPQHGELIDVERQDTSAAAVSSVELPTQVATQRAAGNQTHHQHCLFVSSRGNHKGFRVAGPAVASIIPVAHLTHSRYSAGPRLSLAIYLTAPKHSPPSA